MHTIRRHLDDEHMQLYEWCGAGTGMQHSVPIGSTRSHRWHASCGVLAVMTSLLILNGCEKTPAEQAAEQVDQASKEAEPGGEAAAPQELGPLPESAAEPPGAAPQQP